MFDEGLEEGATHKKSLSVRTEGNRQVKRNLVESISAVVYDKGTRKRIWTGRKTRAHIMAGKAPAAFFKGFSRQCLLNRVGRIILGSYPYVKSKVQSLSGKLS